MLTKLKTHFVFCSNSENQPLQAKPPQTNTIKMSSINVPLHRANAETKSMIRRIAPSAIMARRLSLPYSRQSLPKLMPKPNIVKKVSTTQISKPNGGFINVHRISPHQNIIFASASSSPSPVVTTTTTTTTTTPKPALRPLPGLTKVANRIGNVSKVVLTNGQQNMAKKNIVMIRKSARPPPSTPSPSSGATAIQLNTLKPIKIASPTGWTPVKSTQIARLPPALTPAPRPAKLPVKTYSNPKNAQELSKLPIISQVHSIVPMNRNSRDRVQAPAVRSVSNARPSNTVQNVPRFKTT